MADAGAGRPSYLRAAFANLYNLSLLGGVAAAAAVTGDWWLLGVGLSVEALWLLFAPDDRRFRRAVDARHGAERRLEEIRRMQEQIAFLPTDERARIQRLTTRAAEVRNEVQRNPRLGGDFLALQLERLEDLVTEFVHLAVTTSRALDYLARSDSKTINRQRDEHRRTMEQTTDEGTRAIAWQNREILEKRLAVIDELGRFAARAKGQMSLIENTIALLRDQIVTMATPEALSTQLDTLVASVEAIRDATREAERVVGGAESAPPETSFDLAPPHEAAEASERSSGARSRVKS